MANKTGKISDFLQIQKLFNNHACGINENTENIDSLESSVSVLENAVNMPYCYATGNASAAGVTTGGEQRGIGTLIFNNLGYTLNSSNIYVPSEGKYLVLYKDDFTNPGVNPVVCTTDFRISGGISTPTVFTSQPITNGTTVSILRMAFLSCSLGSYISIFNTSDVDTLTIASTYQLLIVKIA